MNRIHRLVEGKQATSLLSRADNMVPMPATCFNGWLVALKARFASAIVHWIPHCHSPKNLKEKSMFTIGEFSKIAQTPASLLRYYDEIGLFKPVRTDEWTGYRYYSAQQLPQLNRILALKELGMSLDQIARLVQEDISPDEIRGMFVLKKAQLEQQMQEELARLRMLESRLRHIDNDGDLQEFDVVLKALPAQRYLSVRDTYADPFDTLLVVEDIHRLLPNVVSEKALGHMTAVVYGEVFEMVNVDAEIGFPYSHTKDVVVPLSEGRTMRVGELPAVETAITSVRVGMAENSHLNYGAMGSWVEANNYRFSGPLREVFLVPPMPGRENETVVELQFPVERRTSEDRKRLR